MEYRLLFVPRGRVTDTFGGKMESLTIRNVRPEDAARLAGIYSYYVLETAVSFEYDAPTAEEFANRIKNITAK